MLRRAFMAAAVGWAAALPLAAWSAARPAAWPMSALAFGVYAVGGLVCHQLPERSFHLWSVPLPVCARCTGIYVGGAIVAIIAGIGAARSKWRPTDNTSAGRRFGGARATLVVAALPTIATLLYEWTTGQMPANWIRALAGVPIGAAVVWVIVSASDSREPLRSANARSNRVGGGAPTRVADRRAPRERK